ncbi:uncharacterized protein K444DRAFT_717009 [Hyaloscypha bicolor E]|uniref:Uncharacterized protein n=1 Tax=Hyaloscypha bicolor E TaxID=1095630 RepID=A0A2J6THB3_9HELO|nr:uncharacterized protein K444DRAFT_717009 [Hyaloscypha bicolor E]PMD62381.1 hypothetical protein K444DRAFT_717009 [Hyaloscypha bicolor E]
MYFIYHQYCSHRHRLVITDIQSRAASFFFLLLIEVAVAPVKVVVSNPTPLGPMLIACPLYTSVVGFAPGLNVNVFTIEELFVHEAGGSTNYPTELAADAPHERFELPAPLGPAELDSDSRTWEGTIANGTADSAGLSAYE